jgi:allantoicase
VEIDTAHFKGNFPESCEVEAIYSEDDLDVQTQGGENLQWTVVLPRTKLGPHRQHYLQLENVENTVFTHVKMTIYPDGGVKRIRVIGLKADSVVAPSLDAVAAEDASIPLSISPSTVPPTPQVTTIPVLPLTPEAFSPFGQVIQGYSDLTAAPKGTKITPANAGTANKFHKLTLLSSSYPASSNATAGISVYRCQPLANISPDGLSPLTVLERHPYTNQAFVPMGKGGAEGLKETSDRYLVVVAHNGADDKPDLKTLRAFWASTAQGIVYNAGLWHQPMTVLGKVSLYCDSTASMTLTSCPQALDLACVETQIGDGSAADCEILELDTSEHVYKLRLGGLV